MKTAANTSSTMLHVPEMVPVKYKPTIIKAIITLIILSKEPIFFFIFSNILIFALLLNKINTRIFAMQ